MSGLINSAGSKSGVIGIVTNPNQPAFHYYIGTTVSNRLKDNWHTMPCNTKRFDYGDNYDTSTYTFTAPIKGRYLFNWSFALEDVQNDATYMSIMMSTGGGVNTTAYDTNVWDQDGRWGFTGSGIWELSTGDTAHPRVLQAGGTQEQFDFLGGACFFSGYLLG